MGIFMAMIVLLTWSGHLIYVLLYVPVLVTNPWMYVHILIQTWLFTGLFITGHDAMHGTVSRVKWLNNGLGFVITLLYAGLWYPTLIKKHHLHHKHSGTADDPDYCIENQNFLYWWFSFMKQYVTWWQFIIMAVLFNIGLIFFNELQLIVLWIVPAIASTFQLFYFGTYLPHRLPHTHNMEPHHARSLKTNHLWAMISCYFFGYHYEHHASPHTPWWKLYCIKK
jgi:beta-carotene ketolase (CrtW type)